MTRRIAARIAPIAVLAVGAAIGAAGLTGIASADTVTETLQRTAAQDAYVSTSRPGYTFGTNPVLVTGRQDRDVLTAYLTLTAAPTAGATITAAALTLTRDGNQALPVLKLVRVTDSGWSERTLTAATAPKLGATVASVTPKPTASTVTFDLTAAITTAGTHTFAITTPANDTARLRSIQATTGRPVLTLTTTRPKPATPKPTVPAPTAPAPTKPAPTKPVECAVNTKLVPSCGVLWGAAAGGFSDVPRDEALKTFEAKTGRTAAIYHTYHKGDELFPTKDELAMINDPARPRTLMLNWKVDYGTTWANVARGDTNTRIDRLATHLKNVAPTKPYFMVIHHEPENDVIATTGSGMTAKDYAAMVRHTVLRLRAQGVGNAVFVMAYMNYEKWNNTTWWHDLYPGDDVTDWIGVDTYNNAQPGGFHTGDFTYLMNRTTNPKTFPGWYTWATTKHADKPIMVAEWGVYDSSPTVVGRNKANVYDTVLPQLTNMPAIKGLVYFETAKDQNGHDIRMDDTPEALTAFKKITADPRFNVKL